MDPNWLNNERLLRDVLLENVREQRLKRRWGLFFKSLFVLLLAFIIWGSISWDSILSAEKKHVAQINIHDQIMAESESNAADIIAALHTAEADPQTQAIILDINSPGGSPVQASYIYNEIRRLTQVNPKVPIYSVCEDLCASAAYYIASGSAKIYANPTSLVGSIGVLMDEFGFVDAMKKFGVSRRVFTSGDHKAFLDPFSPLKASETQLVQTLLDDDHQVFIDDVKRGRGDRLASDPQLFSGLIWNGRQALPLGLIDGFGSSFDVARTVFHNENIIDYTITHSALDKVLASVSAEFFHTVKDALSRTVAM